MSFHITNLRKPTPKKMRRWGNALFLAAQGAAGLALIGEHRGFAIGLTAAGFLGKFVAEMFADDDKPSQTN